MTKTWISLHGVDLFAVAGIWRWSEEWGDVYSMVMVDGCAQMSEAHDRMPVLLRTETHDQWMQGTPEEAMALVRTCDDALIADHSTDPWFKARSALARGALIQAAAVRHSPILPRTCRYPHRARRARPDCS